MRDRFGLDFRIAGTDAVRQLRRDRGIGANVFTSFPRLIVSIDWLKDRRAQSLLDEVLAGVDHRRRRQGGQQAGLGRRGQALVHGEHRLAGVPGPPQGFHELLPSGEIDCHQIRHER